ncbi:hypothetical protein RND81_11G004700 [Saponaria officinalis]|uniref:J domain-containing protein n=2 Tax=Saponaria officinalis TaxID=3572 RepID=A0AAW1HGE6_SAPOF
MECNKDDAVKAREIAERKFNAKDIAGAKKFALKAQNLYPGLEGIAQLLVTLDVYASSENQVVGEEDWYGVLGVSPQADDDTVRKQYRKLALILHPDKNKSVGAEGAFKLISQAWSLLSDKNRRAAYDAKRKARAKIPSEGSSKPTGANGLYNFPKTTTSNVHTKLKKDKNVPRTNGSSTPGSTNKSNQNTFWTVCHRCRMQYEYLRTYLNQNLLCPTCRQPFFAIEQPPPNSKSSKPSKTWNAGQHSRDSHRDSKGDFQWVPFSGAAGVSSVAHAANVVQQTYEKVRRVREEAQAAKKRDKVMKRKKYVYENVFGSSIDKKQRVGDYVGMNNHQMGHNTAGFGISKVNGSGVLSQIELHNMLMDKARKEIKKMLNAGKSTSVLDGVDEKAKTTEKGHDQDKSTETMVTNTELQDVGSINAKVSIPVPDSDFHNFDKYRTESDFEEGQVWAVYDDTDGMPRYYAMIHRIISRDPFSLRISWLNSKTNTKISPMNWVGCGFTKTCGDFRVGKHETYNDLNCFSHKVRSTKGPHGAICIFPRKGDVWALYRNWSPEWDELTGDDVIHKYDMVEILEDYDEDLGVVIIPLVKVAGFKALFHHHLDPEQVRQIPKTEMFRFSHQIPSRLLSRREAPPNVPKGCRELDPAALPAEFLKVIAVNKATDEVEVAFHDDTKPVNIVTKSSKETKDGVI